jgi:hypothetical protein
MLFSSTAWACYYGTRPVGRVLSARQQHGGIPAAASFMVGATMKRTAVLITFLSAMLLPVCAYGQKISIDYVSATQGIIRGQVRGLTRADSQIIQNMRVVVYVHTDKWYKHPFATGGLGHSYTKIDTNATWSIAMVQDEERHEPDAIAALIVDASTVTPPKLMPVELMRLTYRDIDIEGLCPEPIHLCPLQ